MSSFPETWGIVVAGGGGKRFGSGELKQFAPLAGKPMVLWSVDAFRSHPAIIGLSLVVPARYQKEPPDWLARLAAEGLRVVAGGGTRSESVRAGLETVESPAVLVAVHDAVRPLITPELITRVLAGAAPDRGAIAARRVTDTLKEAVAGNDDEMVRSTVDRARLWRAETPQIFGRELLVEVYRRAAEEFRQETDCAALCEAYGIRVKLVEIDELNLKVTHPPDALLAEALLAARGLGSSS